MGRLRAGGGIAPRPKLHSGAGLFESEPAHRGRATACQGGHYSTGRQRVREHNEFGEIGLDHDLMESSNEDLVLLQSGCLCCTIRDDLAGTLRSLFLRRVKGEITEFDRVIIETTGLADPAPILHTLMTDRLLGVRYRLDGVITTVDAATGQATLDRQIESVKQAAVADRLLLTKTDLVDPQEIAALIQRLRALNPAAPILQAVTAATIRPRCGGRLNWGDWTAEPRPDPIMVRLGKVAASRRSRPGIHSHCRYPPPTHRSDCSDESRHLWHGLPDSPS